MILPRSQVVVRGRGPVPPREVVETVFLVLRRERRRAVISVKFVGRDRMRALHRRYKRASRTADVLAFTLRGPAGVVVGDIYVCAWVARREARARRIPAREEALRYVIHGVLHVLGYDHPDDGSRVGSPMWKRQERYLAAVR